MKIALLVFIPMLLLGAWYLVAARLRSRKVVSTDEVYQQKGIRVEYKPGIIRINKYIYPVSKVINVSRITESKGRRSKQYIKLEVDDMVKPVHRVTIRGSNLYAEEFNQRLRIALRKAGAISLKLY